jgi:hypothetical protein
VFLIGGFAESPYLQEVVQQSLDFRGLKLRKPDPSRAWTAVVRGATICGIEKGTLNLTTISECRQSFGIAVDQPFSDVIHDFDDHEIHPLTNESIAESQLVWLLNKGDAIMSNAPRTVDHSFEMVIPKGAVGDSLEVYSYNDGGEYDRPRRVTDINRGMYSSST